MKGFLHTYHDVMSKMISRPYLVACVARFRRCMANDEDTIPILILAWYYLSRTKLGGDCFPAAVLVAHKMLQDESFHFTVWTHIFKIPISQIFEQECHLLHTLEWKCHVTAKELEASWLSVPPPIEIVKTNLCGIHHEFETKSETT